MSDAEVLDIIYRTFQLALRLALPFLFASMIVGIIIAVFQAATQINEQALSFVPKLLSILAMLALLGGSMLTMLQDFFREILAIIVGS